MSASVRERNDLENVPEEPRHWRLCANKARKEWRLRDERTGDLWHVNGYVGLMHLNWFDGGSHLFHDGVVKINGSGEAVFWEGDTSFSDVCPLNV